MMNSTFKKGYAVLSMDGDCVEVCAELLGATGSPRRRYASYSCCCAGVSASKSAGVFTVSKNAGSVGSPRRRYASYSCCCAGVSASKSAGVFTVSKNEGLAGSPRRRYASYSCCCAGVSASKSAGVFTVSKNEGLEAIVVLALDAVLANISTGNKSTTNDTNPRNDFFIGCYIILFIFFKMRVLGDSVSSIEQLVFFVHYLCCMHV